MTNGPLLLCKCGTANYPTWKQEKIHQVTVKTYTRYMYQCGYCVDSYYKDEYNEKDTSTS